MFQGGLSQATGQAAQASEAFDRVLAIDPKHAVAHLERASIDISEKTRAMSTQRARRRQTI